MTNEEFIESISLEGEIWKDIIGYENLYAISNYGRVASFQRYVVGSRRKCMRINPHRIMKLSKSNTKNGGYMHLYLRNEQGKRLWYIHRLLAIHFIKNEDPEHYKEIDHIDGNTLNNALQNLRWTSHKMNLNNEVTLKRFRDSYKPRECYNAIPIIRFNDTSTKKYNSISEAGKEGFSRFKIRRCCNGHTSSYSGFKWMYLSEYETLSAMSKNSESISKDD